MWEGMTDGTFPREGGIYGVVFSQGGRSPPSLGTVRSEAGGLRFRTEKRAHWLTAILLGLSFISRNQVRREPAIYLGDKRGKVTQIECGVREGGSWQRAGGELDTDLTSRQRSQVNPSPGRVPGFLLESSVLPPHSPLTFFIRGRTLVYLMTSVLFTCFVYKLILLRDAKKGFSQKHGPFRKSF